jgi:hypothetical protein
MRIFRPLGCMISGRVGRRIARRLRCGINGAIDRELAFWVGTRKTLGVPRGITFSPNLR